MNCEKCGAPIPEKNKFCTACGAPVEKPIKEPAASTSEPLGFCDKCGNRLNPGDTVCSVCQNAVSGEEPNGLVCKVCGAPMDPGDLVCTQCGTPIKKKSAKPKLKKKLLLLIPAVAALAAVLIFTWPYIANTFAKLFMSEADYFKYVVNANVKPATETVSSLLDEYILNLEKANIAVEGTTEVRINDALYNLAGDMGADIEAIPFNSVSSNYTLQAKKGVLAVNANTSIDGTQLMDMNGILDLRDDGEVYWNYAPINSDYGYINFDDYNIPIKDIIKAIPKKSAMNKMLKGYIDAALKAVDDVEESSETLEADGVSQKVTKLVAVVDEEVAYNAVINILKQAKSDKELKKFIENIGKIDGVGIDYDDFADALDMAIDQMEDTEPGSSDEKVYVTLYVNAKGEIVGFELELEGMGYGSDSSGHKLITMYNVQKGTKIATYAEINVPSGGMGITLEGSADGGFGKLNGTYSIGVTSGISIDVIDIHLSDVKINKLKEGVLDGVITIAPSSDIQNFKDTLKNSNAEMMPLLDLSIKIHGKAVSKKESELTVVLNYKDEAAIEVETTVKRGKASNIEIPDECVDANTWTRDADPDALSEIMEDLFDF